MRVLTTAVALAALLVAEVLAAASPATLQARTRAFDHAYNLDYPEAYAALQEALALDPNDPATLRSFAVVAWLEILFARGTVTVDDYLGPLSRQYVKVAPPPARLATAFTDYSGRALSAARQRSDTSPGDVDARYEVGAVLGLQVSYMATVDGKVLDAMKAARRAFNEHERVLAAAPKRKDAGLVVGTYRYVVGSLSPFLRLLAYVAGFGGDKHLGLRLVEEAATFDSETQAEAMFALVLLYNREGRYKDALVMIDRLEARFPRNRLLLLEEGATALRNGQAAAAESVLGQGIGRLASDPRPRIFGEEALWHMKRGAARAALGRADEATADLQRALNGEARGWVKGRACVELGRLAARRGATNEARASYDRAISLCDADNDPQCVDQAKRLRREAGAR
jgi:tetratricopeptide (TPR) repeat protein